jgi:hypothetical protein
LVFEHPKKEILTTDEYRQRSIGTVILPYIKGNEVWGIAKVYDSDAATLMQSTHTSTSPAVLVRGSDSESQKLEDGKTLLIEGNPAYLDHLAVCVHGVWDKGGGPEGIKSGENQMAEEEKVPQWADALLRRFDSIDSRLQNLEKFRADSEESEEETKKREEEEAAKKKADSEAEEKHKEEAEAEERDMKGEFERKDGEEDDAYEKRLSERGESLKKECSRKDGEAEEEFEKRKDSAKRRHDCFGRMDKTRKDSFEAEKKAKEETEEKKKMDAKHDSDLLRENKTMKIRLDELESQFKRASQPLSTEDRDALAMAQARADSVAQHFGEHVLAPLSGESPISYRRRLAAKFQKHSDKLKNVRLDAIDGEAFDVLENQIYADAMIVATSTDVLKAGVLIPHVRHDSAGREITTFTGDMNAWLGAFKQGKNPIVMHRPQGASVH